MLTARERRGESLGYRLIDDSVAAAASTGLWCLGMLLSVGFLAGISQLVPGTHGSSPRVELIDVAAAPLAFTATGVVIELARLVVGMQFLNRVAALNRDSTAPRLLRFVRPAMGDLVAQFVLACVVVTSFLVFRPFAA